MLIINASEILQMTPTAQRGRELGTLNILKNGSILVKNGLIQEVGLSLDMMANYSDESIIDARNSVVMPGFTDPHTHAIWVGDRAFEFEMRTRGKTYLEILNAGGGILSTVKAVRSASLESLKEETRSRLWEMIRHGSTTIEVKTGYGLTLESEIKQLEALIQLDEEGPWELIITFMGAHAIPPEYAGDAQGYTLHLVNDMLPGVYNWWTENHSERDYPFVDVFCEKGVFDLAQTRLILEKAKQLGFPLKIHVDEFENLGGASLAAEMGAVSADHMVKTSRKDVVRIGKSDVVAVALPCTPFGLNDTDYTPAREILKAGGVLSLATDCNPGTAWCESMQFPIALACRNMGLTIAEAIAAGTINAAAAVGRTDISGSISPGKQADLIILSCRDHKHLGYRFGTNLVKTVIKKGDILA
ncbi:MAG: imidazolonepropionase [Anaerolineales bacterium]|nr:imidazolonepropionase [Anaerolineales bacterium]